MRKFILLSTVVFFFLNAKSQDIPEKIIENFWNNYESGDAIKTLDELYANSPWIDRLQDEMVNIKSQFKELPNILGEFCGYELLIEDQIGESYRIYVFMAKFDRQPMRFKFEFYKPRDKWTLQGFSYDYDLDEVLEESANWQLLQK